MTPKKEIMEDLRFCQQLMNKLVKHADKTYDENSMWNSGNYQISGDIIRLRRELNEVRKKLLRY